MKRQIARAKARISAFDGVVRKKGREMLVSYLKVSKTDFQPISHIDQRCMETGTRYHCYFADAYVG